MNTNDLLTIGGQSFSSRLLLGTGKYRDFAVMQDALAPAAPRL